MAPVGGENFATDKYNSRQVNAAKIAWVTNNAKNFLIPKARNTRDTNRGYIGGFTAVGLTGTLRWIIEKLKTYPLPSTRLIAMPTSSK